MALLLDIGADRKTLIDWRLAFLARAWGRFVMVKAGEMDPETAVAELIESIDRRWLLERIVKKRPLPCACECDIIGRWDRMRHAEQAERR
jgi:hypothetical protein